MDWLLQTFSPATIANFFTQFHAEMQQPAFWVAVGKIIWINVLLSGDNALVIAMACRGLEARQRFWGMFLGAGVAVGSFRTEDGTSGRGASSAIRASISRRLRPLARASTASWFSGVRCGRSIRTEVRDIAPEASRSRITGKRRQARAAWIRLQVASSESRSTCVQ